MPRIARPSPRPTPPATWVIRDVNAQPNAEFGACISADLAYKPVLTPIGESRALLPREPIIQAYAAPGDRITAIPGE
jgi:hypothetical protein